MLAFDHFRLDPETGQWWDGKELVRLSPKAGAVLHYLVTHAGQLVSAADIRQAVWGDGGGSAARGHFVQEAGIEEWPDRTLGGRYRFLHALYQNVLYDRVPEARRMQLHRRIAERKAAAYGDRSAEIATELAMHFERGREYRRAIHYCGQTGQYAFVQRRANSEALLHLEKGRALLTHLPDSPDRATQELQILTPLSLVLMLTKGYSTTAVRVFENRDFLRERHFS